MKHNRVTYLFGLLAMFLGLTYGHLSAQTYRAFDEDAIQEASQTPAYQYDARPGIEPRPESTQEPTSTNPKGPKQTEYIIGNILKVLAYAIIGITFIIIAYLIVKKYIGFSSGKKIEAETLDIDNIEDIRAVDFDSQIKKAEEAGDYKTAIRMYYLKGLQIMAERNIIQWQIQKTNQDYLREIRKSRKPLSERWRQLTYAFDYVWYGDLDLGGDQYPTLKTSFQQILQSIR
ncbi:MAG: DUF4129 domain-containing protein [Bacteroidota bacterium]